MSFESIEAADPGGPVRRQPLVDLAERFGPDPVQMLAGAAALGSQAAGSSGFCLDQPDGSRQAGLALQLYTRNGTGAQL